MRPRLARVIVLVVVAVVCLIAGGAIASEMGFKLVYCLEGVGEDSASGTNYVALPYVPHDGLVTARDLFLDIGGSIQQLNRYDRESGGFDFYSVAGTNLPPNGWQLVPGEGYIVKIGAADTPVYRILGSHDSTVELTLLGATSPDSAAGINYVALPYHTTAANARELFLEIGGSIQQINRHVKATDGFDFYNVAGTNLPPNGWDLTPGEALIIKVSDDMVYRPSHY
jgi:hypothetical protein